MKEIVYGSYNDIEKECLVTVVTATYNSFAKLNNSLESVLSQTYHNIEYIITDDGSSSFPLEEVSSLLEKYINHHFVFKLILHENNNGTVRNLNYAYKTAKGKYIINLSCGDVFFDDDVINKIVERFKNNDSDVVVTSRILYSGDFQPLYLLPHYEERKIIGSLETGLDQYKVFIIGKFMDMASGSAMSYSKRILEKIGYLDENYKLWEDGPFLAKFLQIGKLDCAYDIISIWYENNGVSNNRKEISRSVNLLDIDTIKFNEEERIQNINMFTYKQKRMIRFRNIIYKYRHSYFRYLVFLVHPIEYADLLIYDSNRNKRINKDKEVIVELLSDRNLKFEV